MINKVKIKNFKCLENLEIEEMKRINIISGKNSSGKTTILEGIFTILGRTSPDVFARLLNWRGANVISFNTEEYFRPFFNNYDLSKSIEISLFHEQRIQKIKISHTKDGIVPQLPPNLILSNQYMETSSQSQSVKSEMLLLEYFESDKLRTHKLMLSQTGPLLYNDNNEQERFISGFISTQLRNNTAETANFFDDLKLSKKSEEVLKLLKIIEPQIVDIATSSKNGETKVYFDIGQESYKPLELFGDGLARLLYLIVSIAERKNGLLMIDEVERGFHYSIFDDVWKVLIDLSKEYNCQLILTTHSYELLQSLVNINKEINESNISYYRIESQNEIEKYDINELSESIRLNWEVR